MTTNNIKTKATSLKKFLNEKGFQIKHGQCIEAVSHMETGECYNVAKNTAMRILKENEKLSFKDMKVTDFHIDVVIPMDMDTMMLGIEDVNDTASETITGCDYALCDISYEVYPHYYGKGAVAVRVTGYIEDIETLSDLEDYEEEEF